jgi:Ribonuclease G/E
VRRRLLIEPGPGEWRAALVEDDDAVELHVVRGERVEAGGHHLGRVLRAAPGLAALLVDIGDARPGFLPFGEIAPPGARLAEGERVLVRVRRPAQGGKAARLTMALGPDAAALRAAAAGRARPSRLDPPPSPAHSLARAVPAAPEEILVADPAAIASVRAAFPGIAVAHRIETAWPVALDALVEEALAATLAVGGAGAVHIEATRAAVLIDVDSGTPEGTSSPEETARTANLAAARVVARQLRLRNLGGGIVVDFVGLGQRGTRERVRQALAAALAADPAQPRILGWTRLGHLEVVRPRGGVPLAEILLDDAGRPSAATVALAALRALCREARARPAQGWHLAAAPEVAAAAAAILPALIERFALRVVVEPDPARSRERFDIAPG